ncbi:MAG: radical SAM protein [Clostridia bacterium]|nr:radical SAM protein [Clostridia bacterium]
MGKKANIALFIPHAGCPHQCSFCNQRLISGTQTVPSSEDISGQLQQAVERLRPEQSAEIAFFGGSFTALEQEYMIALLQAAQPFLGQKGIGGIRVSTRPDAISESILNLLKEYGVTAVELGAQSTNERVLSLNKRGHTAKQIEEASRLIQQAELELGLQMMTGLYGSTPELDRQTARDLVALSPNTVRIYPTVTFPGTYLYELYQQGVYTPPTLEETVILCSDLLVLFRSAGISVIRLGLHGDTLVAGGIGPCHPALGELCQGRVYFNTVCNALPKEGGKATLVVHPTCISQMVGQKRENIRKLAELGWQCNVVGDCQMPPHTVGITRKENSHVPEIVRSTGL